MTALHMSAQTQVGAATPHETLLRMGDPPTMLTLARAATPLLRVELDYTALTLTAVAHAEVWHYHRWADATIKPLPPYATLGPLYPGDSYIALSPGARALTDPYTLARFLHERDYFNAAKLVRAVLAHLAEAADPATWPADVTVLVVEAR